MNARKQLVVVKQTNKIPVRAKLGFSLLSRVTLWPFVIIGHSRFREMAMMNGAVMGKQAQQPPPPAKPGGIEDLAQVTKNPICKVFTVISPVH